MFNPTITGQHADLIESAIRIPNPHPCSVLDAFIGTKRIRVGSVPTTEQQVYLHDLITQHCSQHNPIKVETLWGGFKGYGLLPYDAADLVDLMALRRYACLQYQVQKHYKPGIDVKIIVENFTSFLLCENPAMAGHRIELYVQSLKQMLAQLDMPFVSFIPESSLIPNHDEYSQTVHIYAARLAAYRRDPSISLEDIGWNGPIIWDHYLPRAERKYPFLTADQRLMKVALYLGNALARKNYGIVKSPDTIKLSFAPYPKGVAPYLYNGRVEWKVKECKRDKRTTPPWLGYGVIRDNDWHSECVYDVLSSRYAVSDFHINGVRCNLLIAA